MSELIHQADIVVIGGGAVGASCFWHLVDMGFNAVLLERKKLTCGTTWHAAGLMGTMRMAHGLTRMQRYGLEFMTRLQRDHDIGFKQNGSISVALNNERREEFLRLASICMKQGTKIDIYHKVDEFIERFPYINRENVTFGMFTPEDGQVNPIDYTQAMAREGRARGANVYEDCAVRDIIVQNGQIERVVTDKGDILTNKIVICGGMWSRELANKIGVNVALHAAEHFYAVSEASKDVPANMPVIRVPDEETYYKEDAGKLLVGAFERVAKPWGMNGIAEDHQFETLPDDMDHFGYIMEAAMNRMPFMEKLGWNLWFNGPESFTPDDKFHIGQSPNLAGCYICTGFNSTGIQVSPGAGKMLAEWVKHGRPSEDLSGNEPARLHYYTNNKNFLYDRTKETLGLLYQLHYPYKQYETGRGARRSVFHQIWLEKFNAIMGEAGGWERPNWFAPDKTDKNGKPYQYEYSWGRQNWHQYSVAEGKATQNGVGLYDQSSFGKFMVIGPDALKVLNFISPANIDVPAGKAVYTQWLNEFGGIIADLTITRMGENQFLVVTGSAVENRDWQYLQQSLIGANAYAINITAGMPMLGIMGPNSRKLLEKLTGEDCSNETFPFATSRFMNIGYADVQVTRLTYVGELGYELYVSADFAQHVLDKILEFADEFAIKPAGYHCLNGLRMEKGYRHFGHDIAWHDSLWQAGLGFVADFNKGDFIGRSATLRERDENKGKILRRMVQFQFAASDNPPLCYHEEPIMLNGKMVGNITSGAFGYRLDRSLGMGYVSHPDGVTAEFIAGNQFHIDVATTLHPVSASLAGWYDPKNERIKA